VSCRSPSFKEEEEEEQGENAMKKGATSGGLFKQK
jgi:hypothetical protein